MAEWLCYTDGSAKSGNDSPGGWGFHLKSPKGEIREGAGSATHTLAKIMEYRAVAEALDALPDEAKALVFSDNQSLVENLTKQLENWAEHDFRTVDPTIATDVRRVHRSMSERGLSVRFQWIRSHNGNAGNERADFLATNAAREIKASSKLRHGPGR